MRRSLRLALATSVLVSGFSSEALAHSAGKATGTVNASGNLPVALLPAATHTTRLRLGGSIARINATAHTITIVNSAHQTYTLEVTSTTKITLGGYPANYADMLRGDHLIARGTSDASHSSIGPNPVLATTIRLSSTNFGGSITAVATLHGATTLTIRGSRGHMLHIDASSQTLVYMTVAGGKETGLVTDLLVGEHIHASGKRVGKFELAASIIHVYPHSHTIGGTITAIVSGGYRITQQNGSRYFVQPVPTARYLLNGKPATAHVLKTGIHIRAHGYYALHSQQANTPTLITTTISASVTVHKPKTPKKKTTTHPTATPTPTPHQ